METVLPQPGPLNDTSCRWHYVDDSMIAARHPQPAPAVELSKNVTFNTALPVVMHDNLRAHYTIVRPVTLDPDTPSAEDHRVGAS